MMVQVIALLLPVVVLGPKVHDSTQTVAYRQWIKSFVYKLQKADMRQAIEDSFADYNRSKTVFNGVKFVFLIRLWDSASEYGLLSASSFWPLENHRKTVRDFLTSSESMRSVPAVFQRWNELIYDFWRLPEHPGAKRYEKDVVMTYPNGRKATEKVTYVDVSEYEKDLKRKLSNLVRTARKIEPSDSLVQLMELGGVEYKRRYAKYDSLVSDNLEVYGFGGALYCYQYAKDAGDMSAQLKWKSAAYNQLTKLPNGVCRQLAEKRYQAAIKTSGSVGVISVTPPQRPGQ